MRRLVAVTGGCAEALEHIHGAMRGMLVLMKTENSRDIGSRAVLVIGQTPADCALSAALFLKPQVALMRLVLAIVTSIPARFGLLMAVDTQRAADHPPCDLMDPLLAIDSHDITATRGLPRPRHRQAR